MKKLLSLALLLFAASASAQQPEATLQTPVARSSEAKYRVQEFSVNASQALVTIEVRDSTENIIRTFAVVDPDAAAFITALDTVRATETGGALRRVNFRILGRLLDAALITGVTLVP